MATREQILQGLEVAKQRGDVQSINILTQALRQSSGMSATERYLARERPIVEKESNIFQNIAGGLGSGFTGMYETGALGAATLLEEDAELAAREKIKNVASAVRPEFGDQESHLYKLGAGIGSILGIGAAGITGSLLAGPVGGVAAGAGLAMGAGAGEASERARAYGATEEERGIASLKGMAIGATEILPLGRIFKSLRLTKADADKVSDTLADGIKEGVSEEVADTYGRRIKEALKTGGYEGAQEATAAVLQNMTERGYNPTRALLDAGVGEEALIGAEAGAILQFFTDTFIRGKGGRLDTLSRQAELKEKGTGETTTAETDDKQKFDDDKATPVNKELEEFANKEGLSLDRAKQIMDYAEATGVSLDDAREEIEGAEAEIAGEVEPPETSTQRKERLEKEAQAQMSADAKKRREEQEKKDATTDTTATGEGVPSDTRGMGDETETGETTGGAVETDATAVGATDRDVVGPTGGEGRADATLTAEQIAEKEKAELLAKQQAAFDKITAQQAASETKTKEQAEEKAKKQKEVEAQITVIKDSNLSGDVKEAAISALKQKAETVDTVTNEDRLNVIKEATTAVKDKSKQKTKTPVQEQADDLLTDNVYTDEQLKKIRNQQAKAGITEPAVFNAKGVVINQKGKRKLTEQEKAVAEARAPASAAQLRKVKSRAYVDIVPDSQDPSTQQDKDIVDYVNKLNLPQEYRAAPTEDTIKKNEEALAKAKTTGDRAKINRAQKTLDKNKIARDKFLDLVDKSPFATEQDYVDMDTATYDEQVGAQIYFSGVRRPIDGVLDAINEIQLFETDTDPKKGEGLKGKGFTGKTVDRRDFEAPEIATMTKGRTYANAKAALRFASNNMSPTMRKFIKQQTGIVAKDLTIKPPLTSADASTARKDAQKLLDKRTQQSYDNAVAAKEKALENLRKDYERVYGTPPTGNDAEQTKALRDYSNTSGKFKNAFATITVENNKVVQKVKAKDGRSIDLEEAKTLEEGAAELEGRDPVSAEEGLTIVGVSDVDLEQVVEGYDPDSGFDKNNFYRINDLYPMSNSIPDLAMLLSKIDSSKIETAIEKGGDALRNLLKDQVSKGTIGIAGNVKLEITKLIDVLFDKNTSPFVLYNAGAKAIIDGRDIVTGPDATYFSANTKKVIRQSFEKDLKQTHAQQEAQKRKIVKQVFINTVMANPGLERRYEAAKTAKEKRAIQAEVSQNILNDPNFEQLRPSDYEGNLIPGAFGMRSDISIDKVGIDEVIKVEQTREKTRRDGFIILNGNSDINAHVILHELTHAVTVEFMRNNPSHPSVVKINKLFKKLKKTAGKDWQSYGFTDTYEFIAEVFTNVEFQRELAGMHIEGETITPWQSFVNYVVRIIQALQNKPRKDVYTTGEVALKEANALILSILNPPTGITDIESAKIAEETFGRGETALKNSVAATDMTWRMTTPQNFQSVIDFFNKKGEDVSKPLTAKQRTTLGEKGAELIQEGAPETVRQTVLGFSPSQALADIASAVYKPLGTLMYKLHDTMERQRGALIKSDDSIRAMRKIVKNLRKGLNAKQVDTLNDMITKATNEYHVDPNAPITEYTKYWAAYRQHSGVNAPVVRKSFDTKAARDKFIADREAKLPDNPAWNDGDYKKANVDHYNELRATWDSLPQEARDIYIEIQKTYENQFAELQEVLFGDIHDNVQDPVLRNRLKRDLFQKLFTSATIKPYFPLQREGKYKLVFSLTPDRADERDQVQVYMFETKAQMEKFVKLLKQQPDVEKDKNGNPIVSRSVTGKKAKIDRAPPTKFVRETIKLLTEAGVSDEVQQQVLSMYIDALPESNYAKSLQQRKGYEGFIEDHIGYVAGTKGLDLGRQIVRLKYAAKLRSIETEIDTLRQETPEDKVKKGVLTSFDSIFTEVQKRVEFAINPDQSTVPQALNRMAFLYTIGLNVSSALVNASQIPLVVMPYLGAKYGYGNARIALGDAGKILINSGMTRRLRSVAGTEIDIKGGDTIVPSISNYFRLNKDGVYEIDDAAFKDTPKAKELRKMVEELQPLVQLASERGQLGQSYISDSLSVSEDGKERSFMNRITSFSAWGFHHIEQTNRQTALVASYLLEKRAMEKAVGRKLTDADLEIAARTSLYKTQETNAGAVIETGPRWAQKDWGRVALMYKPYGIQMYYTMLKSARALLLNMFPGSDIVAKAKRNMAMRELAGVHGTALLFAGVRGIPLYGAVKMLFDMFLDDDEEDFDTIVRKQLGEGWYKGGLTSITGADISSRAALSGLLFQYNRYNQDANLEEMLAFQLGGPAFSTIKGFERGWKDIKRGHLERGYESFMPTAIRNAYKSAIRYRRDEGILTRRGDPIYDDLSSMELAAQFVGFAPAEYTKRQEINMILKKIEGAVRDKRQDLMLNYYVAMRNGDIDEAANIVDEIDKFNAKHPEAGINQDSLTRSMRSHIRTSATSFNGVQLAPMLNYTLRQQADEIDQGFQLF